MVNPGPLWRPITLLAISDRVFGFAADLGTKTTFRGGFGIFTNMIPTVYPDQGSGEFSPGQRKLPPQRALYPHPHFRCTSRVDEYHGAADRRQWKHQDDSPQHPVNYAPYAAILGALYVDDPSDRMRNGYTINGNFTLEHEFPGDIAVSASYVANNGVSLYNSEYPNAYYGSRIPVHALQPTSLPVWANSRSSTTAATPPTTLCNCRHARCRPTHGITVSGQLHLG